MTKHFVFCHGWAFTPEFFRPLGQKLLQALPTSQVTYLDLGYFTEKQDLQLPIDEVILIGHSLGMAKLLKAASEQKIKAKAIIGLQSFTNFLGYDHILHEERLIGLNLMIKSFKADPVKTILSFRKKCGINLPAQMLEKIQETRLLEDLEMLKASFNLPSTPALIIGSADDPIVSQQLLDDNFSHQQIIFIIHASGKHSLGFTESDFVCQQIIKFLYDLK